MNPTSSSIRSNRAPPTTIYTTTVPLSGETATAIASHGAREVPEYAMAAGSVVLAYVYMDSIFFAADVQCRLADPTNLEDDRTKYEEKMLERQGKLRKLRPCVVTEVVIEADETIRYILCPMAGFHEEVGGGSRQSHKDLEEPASLLVRPVQTTYNNETFGTHTAYQFEPEWNNGPQYLFPIQVSRNDYYVANRPLEQVMDTNSFIQLLEDIEEVSNVWKKWRDAEHVVVEFDRDIPVFKSEWDPKDWGNLQWKAYPSTENRRGDVGNWCTREGYLELTNNMKFTKETADDIPFKELTDGSTLSNVSEEGRSPLLAPDTLPIQDGHTPSRTSSLPYQVDFSPLSSSRTPYDSKEMPDSHSTVPSHSVPAPPPRVTSLLTKRDVILTEMTSQSPHGEPRRLSDGSIQGHQAAGAIGDAALELEGPSDMDISSVSNASTSRSKDLAKRHPPRSSERSDSPPVEKRDPDTPKVGDKTPHSSQHLLMDSVKALHCDPHFLPESDRIPVNTHTVSEVSDMGPEILGGDFSIYSWKKAVKRPRSSEDELSAADIRPKRQRTTQN